MFDAKLKPLITPSLVQLGKICLRFGLNANTLTVIGFGFGFCCGVLICVEAYGWAIGALLLNRMCDGLDGAVARLSQPTEFGGYLDIVCDFIFSRLRTHFAQSLIWPFVYLTQQRHITHITQDTHT